MGNAPDTILTIALSGADCRRKERNRMDELKLSFEEMISRLDTACGMLLVAAMSNATVREAMETVTTVSVSLGEWGQEQDGEGK